MLKRIGAEESGEFKAVASGALASGKPVIINADGTVSVISQSSGTQAAGTKVAITSNNSYQISGRAYDTANDKVVFVYTDLGNSSYGTAVVGTVNGSDNSISLGTPVAFNAGTTYYSSCAYDESNGKIVIAYQDAGDSNKGKAIVGTVSGTSISFGTEVEFSASITGYTATFYHPVQQSIVIAYEASASKLIAGTVSGTSISFGSVATLTGNNMEWPSFAYDSDNDKLILSFEGSSNYGYVGAVTVSGTTVTMNQTVIFNNASTQHTSAIYDKNAQKFVIFYTDQTNSNYGSYVTATVSGTTTTVSGETVHNTAATYYSNAAYHEEAKKVFVAYRDASDGGEYKFGTVASGALSADSITFDTAAQFSSGVPTWFYNAATYDPDQKKVVLGYRDPDSGNTNVALIVFDATYTATSLTSENYIGMSRGTAFQTGNAPSVGTSVAFNSASTRYTTAAYDSNAQKVVIAYRDGGNSNKGNCVVGTVDPSDNSITFGSEINFENANTQYTRIVYDSNAQKVVIVYRDGDNSDYGTAIVGTVSGTSISFGTAAVFNTANTSETDVTYDSDAQKIVVIYADSADSGKGTAKVGTVSGTSISFGSATQFSSNNFQDYIGATYDENAQKVVIACRDTTNSFYGTAVVGTVSGTSISFGTPVVYNQGTSEDNKPVYDPSSQKVVIFYRDGGNSDYGTAIVGTVSGTSISFGTEVVFNEANTDTQRSAVYDSSAQKVVTAYRDAADSFANSYMISGKVSGTSITFDSETSFHSGRGQEIGLAYDSGNERVVISFRDSTNSSHGKAAVGTTNTIATTRSEIADGGNASMDIIGSVSDNQIGLTAGQQYFVQTDGTIGTTADSPSVLAGTAISATELLVKT